MHFIELLDGIGTRSLGKKRNNFDQFVQFLECSILSFCSHPSITAVQTIVAELSGCWASSDHVFISEQGDSAADDTVHSTLPQH